MPRYNFAPPRPDYPAASVAHLSSAALRQALHDQFGQGFARVRRFREFFLKQLRQVAPPILTPGWTRLRPV